MMSTLMHVIIVTLFIQTTFGAFEFMIPRTPIKVSSIKITEIMAVNYISSGVSSTYCNETLHNVIQIII